MVHARRAARGAAFTLVELVIVVALLGLVAAVALPEVSLILGANVEAAALQLRADLLLARERALATRRATSVRFDPAGGGYTLYRDDPADLVADDPIRHGIAHQRSLESGEFRGVDLVSADFGGLPRVVFDPRGRPASAGTVVLAAGGTTRTLTVVADTGYVDLQR